MRDDLFLTSSLVVNFMPQSHYSWRMNPQYYQNSSPVTEPKVQYYIRENGSLKYFVKVTDSTSNVFTM